MRGRGNGSGTGEGNLAVALLLAPTLLVVCKAFLSVGERDYSEAWAWGIVAVVMCRWLGRAERA